MDVELIFKIAAIGIIVAVLCQLLIRSGREDQAMLTSLAGKLFVTITALPLYTDILNTVLSILQR